MFSCVRCTKLTDILNAPVINKNFNFECQSSQSNNDIVQNFCSMDHIMVLWNIIITEVCDLYIAVDIFCLYQLGQEQSSGRWELLGIVSNQASSMQNNQRETKALASTSVLPVRSAGLDVGHNGRVNNVERTEMLRVQN